MELILISLYREYFYFGDLLAAPFSSYKTHSFIRQYRSYEPFSLPPTLKQLYYMYLVSANLSCLQTLSYGDYLFDLKTINLDVDMENVRKFYQTFQIKKFSNCIKNLPSACKI